MWMRGGVTDRRRDHLAEGLRHSGSQELGEVEGTAGSVLGVIGGTPFLHV